MEQIRTLEAIKTEVNKLVKDREESIRLLMDKHEAALQNELAANEKANEAYKAANISAYHKALDEARSNKDAAQMFISKAEELRTTPYIDKEQYEEFCSEITEYLERYIETRTEAFRRELYKLAEIGVAVNRTVDTGNSLLKDLQLNVYKDAGVTIHDGRPIYQRSPKKEFRDFSLISAWYGIKNVPYIDKLLEQKEN